MSDLEFSVFFFFVDVYFFFFRVNSFFVGGCNCEIVLWSKNNFTEFSQKGLL